MRPKFDHYRCKMPPVRNKVSYNQIREEKTLKNGIHHAVFNKGIYTGDWKNNLKNGYGTYLSLQSDRFKYEGSWKDGLKHGYGILSKKRKDSCFDLCYEGEWDNGKKEGQGQRHYIGGDFYDGEWMKGQRHGRGRIWYANGEFYEGEWLNDKRHGLGLFVQENGNRYEGYWSNGLKHGKGYYFHLNTGQVQTGVWREGQCYTSIFTDIPIRQSACNPTQYPIPRSELADPEGVYNKAEKDVLTNSSLVSFVKSYH